MLISDMSISGNAIHFDRKPDITVVIPSYNHGPYIQQAIDSVLLQTHDNWELIVIDDGSTDNTRELLDAKYRGNPKIQLVYQENCGAHHAINRGISQACGRYISILNSDDIYHQDRLRILLNHGETKPGSLIFTPLIPVDAQACAITKYHPWHLFYEKIFHAYLRDGPTLALLTGNFAVTTSNFFFPADLIKQIGGFRKMRYNHDWEFMLRVLRGGREIICAGHEPLLSYRLHGHNTIMQNTLMARLELKRVLRDCVPSDDPYLQKLISQFQLNMRSIRLEHQLKVIEKNTIEYNIIIKKLKEDSRKELQKCQEEILTLQKENAFQSNQVSQMSHSLSTLQQHLKQIQDSHSYKYARLLSKFFSNIKKFFY